MPQSLSQIYAYLIFSTKNKMPLTENQISRELPAIFKMTRYPLILFLALLIACSTNKPKQNYSIPKNNDISDIVEVIIYQNNLPVLRYSRIIDTVYDEDGKRRILSLKSVSLCINLEKFNVIHPIKDTLINGLPPPPPPPNTLTLNELLSVKIDGKNFFSESDSSYFLFLNDALKNFTLPKDISKNILVTTNVKEMIEKKLGEMNSYYSMSIPVFSKDNKKAYVIVGFHCFLCGYGTGIYLKKLNDKWQIVKIQKLWVS